MLNRTDIIYRYDGTWEGLLGCVFESFLHRTIPWDIQCWDERQLSLIHGRVVETDLNKARRVADSLRTRISVDFYDFIKQAYLTCLPDKELQILILIHKAYRVGPQILDHLTDDTVSKLTGATEQLRHEAHLLTGFIRFSLMGAILVSQDWAQNQVLPLLAPHFAQRYPREAFLIHDQTHGMALVYRPYEWAIVPMTGLEMADPDAEEMRCRTLWREYYDAIAVEGRENPRCRMSHMPKRYWRFMTEFQREERPILPYGQARRSCNR